MSTYTRVVNSFSRLSTTPINTEVKAIYQGTGRDGIKGTTGLQQRIRNLPVAISKVAKVAALEVGKETFQASLDRVPIDTGQMCESGRLTINNRQFAKGRYLGGDNADFVMIGNRAEEELRTTNDDLQDVIKGTVNIGIEYHRVDEEGRDITMKLHDDLNEYGSGKFFSASKEGRGPKFVEQPMNQIAARELQPRIVSAMNTFLKTAKL